MPSALMHTWCIVSWTTLWVHYSFGKAAIIQEPHSQVVLPGQGMTTFQCMVNEFGIWFVNGTGIDDSNAEAFQNRGITYAVTEIQSENGNTITNLTLFVENRPGNNGTLVQCYAYGSDVATSSYASLTIAGPPLPPSPSFQILNPTMIAISWDKPFTWTEVADILGYTVRLYNSSSQELMNWTDSSLIKTNKYNHQFTVDREAEECIELTFEVSATNIVGRSKYGTTRGGFPIAMKWPEQGNGTSRLSTTLEYKMDGSILVNCTIQVPIMCNYQQASFYIVISSYRSGSVVAKTVSTQSYVKGDTISIPLTFKPQTMTDTEYNVILVISSFGTDLQALTSFNISPTLMPKEHDEGGFSPVLIAGVASGVLAAVFVIVVSVVFFTCLCMMKAKKHSSKGPDPDHYYEQAPPLPPVVEHLYEHIQDYQKKNSVALVVENKLESLDSNWQSIHLVNSDLMNDSVVALAPSRPQTLAGSRRNTRVENQTGDYVEMRMIIDSQDGKCGSSFVSCEDFPASYGSSSLSCGPLAAL